MEWIDVKKQAPIRSGEYLVVFDCGQKFVLIADYNAEANKWKVYDHYGDFWGEEVLYWMELPKIPK